MYGNFQYRITLYHDGLTIAWDICIDTAQCVHSIQTESVVIRFDHRRNKYETDRLQLFCQLHTVVLCHFIESQSSTLNLYRSCGHSNL